MTRRRLLSRSVLALLGAPILRRGLWAAESAAASPGKGMRLGSVTYNIAKDWNVPTIIKNFEATGFEGVELRTTHAHGVEVTLSKEQRGEVRKRFADSKVTLMGLGSTFEFQMPDQARLRKEIEGTKEYIILAQDVGATGVKVRPNGLPKDVSVEKTLEQIGRALHELGPFAADHGQQIRLEVHGAGTSLLPNIKKIMDAADHKNVGVCWNSNQTDLEGAGFDANFDSVKDRIFSVHMRDLYLGEYPFRRLLTRLNQIDFRGFCLAEIPESSDPLRVMRYFRALWLSYQV
ncbi:MAG TPA: sugar phosphate isomerase/epimerase [Verrucomicrobiae bacterium]|nr:sugar phosphate isomerase/epimerase [Verrucomicrobiae bacterium]